MENSDTGGEGVVYHELTRINTGGQCRTNRTHAGSGYFDRNGNFSATNAINPSARDYLLSQP